MRVVHAAGATDSGRKRRRNEDAYVCEPPLFAVADGMGGHHAGEIASRLAAAALREDGGRGEGGEEHVAALIQEANRRVHERQADDPSLSGMGTTITAALVVGDTIAIGHVGDSRAYRIRAGELEQLTEDHSLVAELQRSGKLSPEEAASHPQRSVITRALGTDPDVDVDTFTVEARAGDVYLLCSDGLTSMVDDEEIRSIVEQHGDDLARATKELIRRANKGGGEDNITVVVFELGEEADEPDGRTRETAAAPAADEADTLDEADAVPVLDTAVVPPSEVEPLDDRERPWLWPLVFLVVAVAAAVVVLVVVLR